MSLLKSLFAGKEGGSRPPSGPETAPVKMNLEERMAFRREMLYEAIKVTMQAHGVLSASYKFRVVRNDKRGHQYSVMVDLNTDFLHNREGQPEHLVAVGAAITKNAMTRYGVVVAGVYWRVNDEMQGFDHHRAEHHSVPASVPPELSPRQKYERATAEELAAFEAAWQKGQELHVGDRVYSSDLAPLTGDSGSDSR
ncbi:MAG: hypothetical protein KF740_01270 [Ramlibacter sp.]|nr:hypothetical protein [Ramlibacter sp.]